MRLLLALFLLLPAISCSNSSFHSVNSSATVILDSGWQAKVVSHFDTIEMTHDEKTDSATFHTAGHEIYVGPDSIAVDGEKMVSVPDGADKAFYEVDAFSVLLTPAQ